jgi:hypothetical protein
MGGFQRLIRFDATTGSMSPIGRLSDKKNAPSGALFCESGDSLLSTSGELFDVRTGAVKCVLSF